MFSNKYLSHSFPKTDFSSRKVCNKFAQCRTPPSQDTVLEIIFIRVQNKRPEGSASKSTNTVHLPFENLHRFRQFCFGYKESRPEIESWYSLSLSQENWVHYRYSVLKYQYNTYCLLHTFNVHTFQK